MRQHQSVNIRQISRTRAEQIAYYRLLENESMSVSELVGSVSNHAQQQVAGRHVLAISDSSEINLQAHAGRLKPEGLGVVGNDTDAGFFIHPTLVLDALSGFPLGLSAIQLWTRPASHSQRHSAPYQNLPIEQKESFKWIASAERSAGCLIERGGATLVTHIGDRESDLYAEWATVPDAQNHLLVRACRDRRLRGQRQSLYAHLSAQPAQGNYSIKLEGDSRTGRVSREAWLSVRISRVEIARPQQLSAKAYPPSVRLYALEAREVNPPQGQQPVHWRLLTTHEVVCIEQALQVIGWYKWRWRIEQLFATLKRAGLNLEATQLESIAAIERLTILALSVALKTLHLLEGQDDVELSASLSFSSQQQQCLAEIAPTLAGKTQKQQNGYPAASLPWATWLIARLGGWSGYRSQRPPGIPTLVHGLRQFESIFLGWKLAQPRLVCTR